MAISKAMRLALRALSYPANIDLEKTYKAQRVLESVKAPLLSPLYQLWDQKIERNGKEIRVRLYHPKKQAKNHLLLFFHGGGWVHETVDTYDTVCKNLAKRTGCPVASVEYSLAPEHIFPEAVEDCYAVAKEVYKEPERFGVKQNEITLIGDSAGGNLAAAVALLARDRGEFQIGQQILLYPATYNDHSETSKFESVRENGEDYLLTSKRVREYMQLYAGGDPIKLNSPYFAPLLAENLTNQPRTLIITAEYDPLRDEGEAYAVRLREAGNIALFIRMPEALHGYFSLSPRFAVVRHTYNIIDHFLNGDTAQ